MILWWWWGGKENPNGIHYFCFYFSVHMVGSVSNSFVKNCTIRNTNNRAITVHGVDNLLIEHTVAFNIRGHAFFVEDGVEKNNTFTGEFWSGSTSLKLGLIDGIGNADQILKEKYGEDIIIKKLEKPKSFLAKKLSASLDNQVNSIENILEERTQWQKFGL